MFETNRIERAGFAARRSVVMARDGMVSTGIGGDAFLLYRCAADGRIYGINGSGRSPQRLTLEELQRRGVQGIPRTGLASVTVPGAIDAFVEAQGRHGKLTFAE